MHMTMQDTIQYAKHHMKTSFCNFTKQHIIFLNKIFQKLFLPNARTIYATYIRDHNLEKANEKFIEYLQCIHNYDINTAHDI